MTRSRRRPKDSQPLSTPETLAASPPLPDERTSAALRRILAALPPGEVRVGLLVRQLRRRSFGGVFLLLAALGLLPGISVLAGLAMLVPGAQLLAGHRAPLLPRVLRQRTVEREHLRQLGDLALPWLERIERYVRPRWPALTDPPMPTIIGLLVIGLGLVVVLPLPLSNFPPALALLCLALGLLERDGALVAAGLALAAVALAIGVAIAVVAVKALQLLFA